MVRKICTPTSQLMWELGLKPHEVKKKMYMTIAVKTVVVTARVVVVKMNGIAILRF